MYFFTTIVTVVLVDGCYMACLLLARRVMQNDIQPRDLVDRY